MNHLLGHIVGQHPHIVICTGDLLDSPLSPLGWYQARQLLNGLQEKCGNQCTVRWVPGDHDLAIGGKISIKRVAHAVLRKCFRRYLLDDNPFECPMLGVTLLGVDSVQPFWQSLGRWLFRYKSHPYHEVPNEVLNRLAKAQSELRWKPGDISPNNLKIVAMHHLPLHTIPVEGSTTKLTAHSAGPLLLALAENGTNLLLHGDLHRPAYYRLTVCFDGLEREIISLCAGRIKTDDPWKNSYMLIIVRSVDEISAEVYRMVEGRTFEPAERHDIKNPL